MSARRVGPARRVPVTAQSALVSTADSESIPAAVTAMWDAVLQALREAGEPSARDIERLAAELKLPTLPASTTADWLRDRTTVPGREKFHALIECLGAEKDPGVDWEALRLAAERARRKHLRDTRDRTVPQPAEPPAADPDARSRPPVVRSRRTTATIVGLAIALLAGIGIGWELGRHGHPATAGESPGLAAVPATGRTCAHVVASVARVLAAPEPTASFIKNKKETDQVEIVARPAPRPSAPPGWVPVLLPRDAAGTGWMSQSDLSDPEPCTAPPGGR